MRGWLWIDCRRGVTQVRPDDWQVVAIGRLARGRGGVKGYSSYIKGHAAQGKCSGVFSTLPSSRFISNFHKLRCGADGFFNSNLQIYFKSFLIFVKNLPFNSNFEIYILYLGRDCLYEFVILKNVKKFGGIHFTLRN